MNDQTRSFIVYGRPQAKQRPRLYHGAAFTPEATKLYEAKMRNAYVEAYSEFEPLDGDLYLEVKAYFSKKNHGDLDNIIKCVDGLNKVAWHDDKQVKEIHGYLIVDKTEEERLEVSISPLQK